MSTATPVKTDLHIDAFIKAAEKINLLNDQVSFKRPLKISSPQELGRPAYQFKFSGQQVEAAVEEDGTIMGYSSNPGALAMLTTKFSQHPRIALSQLGFFSRFMSLRPEPKATKYVDLEICFTSVWDENLNPTWHIFPSIFFIFLDGTDPFPMFNMTKAVRIDHPTNQLWFDGEEASLMLTGPAHAIIDRIREEFDKYPEIQEKNELTTEEFQRVIDSAQHVVSKYAMTAMTLYDLPAFYDAGY